MSRREERDVILVEQGGSSFVMPLLFGLAIGAGLGLLFAPRSGEETRRLLQSRVGRLRDLAEDTLEEWHDRLSDEPPAHPADSADEDDDEDTGAAPPVPRGRRSSNARAELERRLAEVRARRRPGRAEDEEPVV